MKDPISELAIAILIFAATILVSAIIVVSTC